MESIEKRHTGVMGNKTKNARLQFIGGISLLVIPVTGAIGIFVSTPSVKSVSFIIAGIAFTVTVFCYYSLRYSLRNPARRCRSGYINQPT
jgi:hypothetical protein